MVLEAVMISRLVGFALEQMIKRNKKPEIPFSRLMRRAMMILIIFKMERNNEPSYPISSFLPTFLCFVFLCLHSLPNQFD